MPLRRRECSELRKSAERTRYWSSRRAFITATGSLGATAALGGCLGFGGEGGSDDGVLQAALVSGEGGDVQTLFEEYVIPETGIEVESSTLPFNQLFETLSTNLEQEDDTFDIVMMDDPWFPRLASHLAPIREYADNVPTDDVIDTVLSIGTWPPEEGAVPPEAEGMESQLRGLCAVGNAQLFAYNERLYDEVGEDEPETWDDVLRAGQAISEDVADADGYVIRGQSGNPIMANYFSLGMSLSGDMFDENWQYQWDNEDGINACSFYTQDLAEISPDGIASFDSDETIARIADGRAAAGPAWPGIASNLLDENNASEFENINITMIPEGIRRAPQQGNWLLGINNYSPDSKKEDAATVLSEFVSAEAQDIYANDIGGIPFRHDTFENNLELEEWFPPLYESLQNAVPRPRTALWSEIEVTQGEYLNQALVGQISPEEAMTSAGEEITGILEGAGYYD